MRLGSAWTRRVGLEASSGSLIAVTLRGSRVTTASMVKPDTIPPGNSLSAALFGSRRRIVAPPVSFTLCEPDHAHRTLLLPVMTAAEKSEVVRREAAREGEEPKAVAWQTVRRVSVDGVPNDELLVVTASAARLQEALDPLVLGGIVPEVVVTAPLALLAAARQLTPVPLDRPTAFVHWGIGALTIIVVSEGMVRFTRVIELPAAELDPFDWIPVEIDRSIRRYAVLSKGERVEQVMVSVASAAGARRVFSGSELAERLRLTVINLNALLAPELPRDIPNDMAPGVFILAYGAALLHGDEVPNLVPPSLAVQTRSDRVVTGAVAAGVALILLLGSSAVSMTVQERDLRNRLARAEAVVRAGRERVEEAARVEAERQQRKELARLLTGDPLRLLPPGDAFREIARLAPGELRLDQLTMSVSDQGYSISLTGRVEEGDFAEAQRALSDFYYGLRGSTLFDAVEIRQAGRIDTPAPAADETSAPASDIQGSLAAAPPTEGVVRPLGFVVVMQLRRLA